MSWNGYAKQATKSEGGEWPDVPDDLYDAVIKDVSDPETQPDHFNPGQERTQFYLTWEIEVDGNPVTMRQYIALPAAYLSDGFLNEKSNLYRTMEALGFDMEDRFRVNPSEWQGMKARVMVENKANTQGEIRPRITAVKPPRAGRKPSAAPLAQRLETKPASGSPDWTAFHKDRKAAGLSLEEIKNLCDGMSPQELFETDQSAFYAVWDELKNSAVTA